VLCLKYCKRTQDHFDKVCDSFNRTTRTRYEKQHHGKPQAAAPLLFQRIPAYVDSKAWYRGSWQESSPGPITSWPDNSSATCKLSPRESSACQLSLQSLHAGDYSTHVSCRYMQRLSPVAMPSRCHRSSLHGRALDGADVAAVGLACDGRDERQRE
jgi:hypothetical protein